MKLTVDTLNLIRKNCESIIHIKGQQFLAVAPDEAVYPFLTYTPLGIVPDWSFNKNYEYIRIQFSIFDNANNKRKVVDIMKALEKIFHRSDLDFNHTESGRHLVLSYKTTERIQYMREDTYWMGTTDYVFVCEKNAIEVDWSSSSSSLSSSSSSEWINFSSSSSESSELSSSSSTSSSEFFESSSSSSNSSSSNSSSSESSNSSSSSSKSSSSSESSESSSSDDECPNTISGFNATIIDI